MKQNLSCRCLEGGWGGCSTQSTQWLLQLLPSHITLKAGRFTQDMALNLSSTLHSSAGSTITTAALLQSSCSAPQAWADAEWAPRDTACRERPARGTASHSIPKTSSGFHPGAVPWGRTKCHGANPAWKRVRNRGIDFGWVTLGIRESLRRAWWDYSS